MIQIKTVDGTNTYDTDHEAVALAMHAELMGYSSFERMARFSGKTVEAAKADLTITHLTSAEIFRAGANRMMAPGDALHCVKSILALRALLEPISIVAEKAARDIARIDADGVIATDCDRMALAAVEALRERLRDVRKAIDAAAEVFMAGCKESRDELVARLAAAA